MTSTMQAVYSEPQPVTKVGEVVKPIEFPASALRGTAWLASGCGSYPSAVVIQLEPKLVLVSPEADMRWGADLDITDYEAIGIATVDQLARCMTRL